jgi:hypothetical protein
MGRLKKGVLLLRGSAEGKSTSGEQFGDRRDLVDWLNRAQTGPTRDREAAERVGALIGAMNDAGLKFFRSWKQHTEWRLSGSKAANWGWPAPESARIHISSLRGLSPDYEPEFDLLPSFDGKKWKLVFHCDVPSGDGVQIRARWNGESDENPESQAIEAIVYVALDGQLGTIKRCEVANCRQWFLTKDDPRVRTCPKCTVDDLRRGTPARRRQISEAQKKAREREKRANEKYWKKLKEKDGLETPGPHRAKR